MLQEVDTEVSIKVIIVGNGRVGKTSMMNRFCKGIMTDAYKKTLGTDFMEKDIIMEDTGEEVKLMLWDTAGQEMFSKLTRSYYRGAGAAVFVFGTDDRESFLEIERWQSKVEDECGDIVTVLVQNKIDLLDDAAMTNKEVEDLARKMNCKLFRTCVKDDVNVSEIFSGLASQYISNGGGGESQATEQKFQEAAPVSKTVTLEPDTKRTKKSGICSLG